MNGLVNVMTMEIKETLYTGMIKTKAVLSMEVTAGLLSRPGVYSLMFDVLRLVCLMPL